MTRQGQFGTGYWSFIKTLSKHAPVPCEDSPEVFFPEDFPSHEVRQIATATAKRLCKACPVRRECLAYAIESNQRYGIWAGTTAAERNG